MLHKFICKLRFLNTDFACPCSRVYQCESLHQFLVTAPLLVLPSLYLYTSSLSPRLFLYCPLCINMSLMGVRNYDSHTSVNYESGTLTEHQVALSVSLSNIHTTCVPRINQYITFLIAVVCQNQTFLFTYAQSHTHPRKMRL